jgi:hypothetical protein
MHRLASLILLAVLAGCTMLRMPPTADYGSFAANASPADDKKMVDDAVKKLVTLYPPALTRFNLRHAAADPFGTALVTTLRAKGYALQEYKTSAAKPGAAGKASNRALAYVFDQPAGTDLYRVTLMIDNQSLSRVYQAKDGSVAAAGYWVRKE